MCRNGFIHSVYVGRPTILLKRSARPSVAFVNLVNEVHSSMATRLLLRSTKDVRQ